MRRVSYSRKFCGRWRWFNHTTGELVTWRCKAWDCPNCGKSKAKKTAIIIGREAKKHEFTNFITITLPRWYHNKAFQDGDRALKKGFQKLVRRYRQSHGQVGYIWVEERHHDGTPHMHILSDMALTKHQLHNECVKAGLGYIADIRPIDGDAAYFYVAKYLAKGEKQIPTNVRRLGASKGIKLNDCLKDMEGSQDTWTLYVHNPMFDGMEEE